MRLWLAVGVLTCVAPAGVADVATPPFTPVAHSAQVTLEAARTPEGVTLHLRRAAGEAPLAVTGLTASIDGSSVPATSHADGSWSVALPQSAAHGAGRLEVIVAHDGIREELSGSLPAAVPGAAVPGAPGGVLRDHKQLAWWVLNIVIVLIAAIAISRRMS